MGESMTAFLSLGILFMILGLVFLIVPFEKLKMIFRRMRSNTTTKIGGGFLFITGVVTIILGFFQ